MHFIRIALFFCLLRFSETTSYSSKRNVPGEKLFYHREITRGPDDQPKVELITFPELSDKVKCRSITGIKIIDRAPKQGSKANVILGGINYPFATVKITSAKAQGYSYDIKIYGID